MIITVNLKKSDLVRFTLFATSRRPSTQWGLLALAVIILGINLYQQRQSLGPLELFSLTIVTLLFVAPTFLFVFLLNLFVVLRRGRKGSKPAERQTYSFTDEGLLRESVSSKNIVKWGGARSVHRRRKAIYIRMSATAYLLFPRHAFASNDEFGDFCRRIQPLAAR